jgi:hypothetical protein
MPGIEGYGKWHRFEDAPEGSYDCVHSPLGRFEDYRFRKMPRDRSRIPAQDCVGYILPLLTIEGRNR